MRKDSFLSNWFAILRFEADKNIEKLRKPVDMDKWATEPAVVNAFYNPNKNDIGKLLFNFDKEITISIISHAKKCARDIRGKKRKKNGARFLERRISLKFGG